MRGMTIARAERRLSRALVPGLALAFLFVSAFTATPSFGAVTFRSAASAGAAAGGISHIGAGLSATRDNCGNITPSIPAGNVGDILVALVVARENSATVTMTGWNLYFTDSYPAQEFQAFIYWRVATGTDPNTVAQSGTCDSLAGQIARFRGVDTANPFETNPILAANWVRQNSDNLDTGTENTTSPTAMLLVAGFIMDNGNVTEGAGWSQSFDSSLNISRDTGISLHYQLQTTAGAKSVSNWALSSGTDPNYGVIFALRPAASDPLTINTPAGTVTGDVMIASVSVTPSTMTVTAPVGWTEITGSPITQGSATTSKLATYYRVAGVGEPASYTWSLSNGAHSGAVGGILSFSGVDNLAPIDAQAGGATASGLSHIAPTVTTTQANGMLVTIHELASSRTWTFPGGMTEAVDVASLAPNNAAGISMEINYEPRPTAGATGARTASVGGNADSGATQSVSLKPTPLVCYTDDFNRANGAPGADWVVSNSSGAFGNPVIFNNRLRLTDASGNVATMATLQRLFPGSGNRIEVEFDHFSYGGSGADGIAITLSDSAVTPVPGGYGGSLGYAQRTGINGFAGGWLGVGIDEFGNYSNPTEGRQGGPGFRVDSVAVRGSGTGTTGYAYHAGTNTLVPQVDNNGAAVPAHRYRIIVDHQNSVNALVSVERDTTASGASYTTLIAPYDAKAQAGQATVPNGWLLSYTGSTGGSTNIHEIDSLRVCATSQTSLSGIHHFEITVAPSASTCSAQNVTIAAKDISNNTLTGYTGSVSIVTSSAHGDWSVISGGGTFSNGAADDGAATYTFVVGDSGVITLALANTHADDLTVNVTDTTVPATSTTSATISFRDSAFVVTPDPIQIAGRNQSITVTLVTGGTCTPDTNYTGSKNLDAWLTLDPSDPGGAVPTIGALTLPTSAPASNPGSNNLPAIAFTSGVATIAMATTDVGRYVLNLRDDTRLYANAVDLGGASPSITTRPWLHVAVSGNPGNNGTGGSVFTSAGTNFSATVRGVLWQVADDANNDGVPDAGANLSNNGVTPSYAWNTILSPTTPFTPATAGDAPPGTGTPGTLNNGSVAQASFSGGSATVATLQYTEVGSFTMRAAANNYLSSGINVTTNNGVVGRFNPAYFDVTRTHGCPHALIPANSFTYSGQPFSVTVTAHSATGGITANYHGPFGFAKDTVISNAGTLNPGTFSNNTFAAANFSGGTRMQNVTYTFAGKETAALTMPGGLALRATDTDSVSSTGHIEETTDIRSGRILIQSAFGSELVDLAVPMRVQYYLDANTGWVTNTNDTCTAVTLTFSNYQGNLAAGEVCVQDSGNPGLSGLGCTTAGPSTPVDERFRESTSTGFSGDFNLYLCAHDSASTTCVRSVTTGYDGSVDITTDLAAMPWLQDDWDGNGVPDNNPQGRATFGIFRGNPRHIYLRERY